MPGWILRSDDEKPVTIRLSPGTTKTVGRAVQADFILEAPLVSRVHCRLTAEKSNQLTVEDLESTNGTEVNGQHVDRAVLKPGDVVTIGRVKLTVEESS